MPFPEVTLSDGKKVRLDSAAYTQVPRPAGSADRILVFREFWKTYKEFERTFGVTLDAQAQRDFFYAQARKYPSCLAAALDGGNVPEAVYRTLIAETNNALPTLHRAFRLRAKLLGIPDLGVPRHLPAAGQARGPQLPDRERQGSGPRGAGAARATTTWPP